MSKPASSWPSCASSWSHHARSSASRDARRLVQSGATGAGGGGGAAGLGCHCHKKGRSSVAAAARRKRSASDLSRAAVRRTDSCSPPSVARGESRISVCDAVRQRTVGPVALPPYSVGEPRRRLPCRRGRRSASWICPLGSRGTEASHRSVPAGRGGAAMGKPEGERKKFSLLLTTRFGNAVPVITWNTYTWKPASAKADVTPPRASAHLRLDHAGSRRVRRDSGPVARTLLAGDHPRLLCSLRAGSRQQGARHNRRSARGAGGATRQSKLPRFSPASLTGDPGLYAPE